MWQDTALTLINFGFIITLLPALIHNYRLKDVRGQSLLTYASTALLLTVMSVIFFTLELYLTCVSTAGTGIMWYLLTYQKMKYSPTEHSE